MSDVETEIPIEPEEDFEKFIQYEITTYPSDLTLQGIYDLWENNELVIPNFQRNFVWTIKQSSLLIESFMLGLPVPPVILYVSDEYENLVIDGQQRLTTIKYFFEGYFGLPDARGRRRVFRLEGLGEGSPFKNRTYQDFAPSEQRKFRSFVLRVVNIKQMKPAENEASSVYHIFERLNTGGTPLKPQEIRNCVYHGKIVDVLRRLNEYSSWRQLIGYPKPDKHERDVELILRVLSLSLHWERYERPLRDFLNQEMKMLRNNLEILEDFEERFEECCDNTVEELGVRPFNLRGPLNAAALDSVLGILVKKSNRVQDLQKKFTQLIGDKDYQSAIDKATADTANLQNRFRLASIYLD